MTEAGYKRATEVKLELHRYKEFRGKFAKMSGIKEVRVSNCEKTSVSLDLQWEPELEGMIGKYIADKISALEKEFEQLN